MRTVIVTAFATGFGLGFLVAAQIGPISLLCVRSVLRGQLQTGLGISLGVAIVDIAYAALGVAGITQLLRLPQLRLAVGLAGRRGAADDRRPHAVVGVPRPQRA